MRHLLAGQLERLLPDHLGDPLLDAEVGRLLPGEVQWRLRQQGDELLSKLREAVACLGTDRV